MGSLGRMHPLIPESWPPGHNQKYSSNDFFYVGISSGEGRGEGFPSNKCVAVLCLVSYALAGIWWQIPLHIPLRSRCCWPSDVLLAAVD